MAQDPFKVGEVSDAMQELIRQAKKADREDIERAERIAQTVKTPGWSDVMELLGARIQIFADAVMQPAGSVDRAVGLEYIKGAMSGLIIARDLASVIIQASVEIRPPNDEDNEDDDVPPTSRATE